MAGIFRKWEICTTLNQINCFVFIERILSFINVKKVLWTKKCKIWCKMEYESSPKQKCCNKNFLWISLWMTLHRRFFFNKLKFITWTSHLKQRQNRKKNNNSKCNIRAVELFRKSRIYWALRAIFRENRKSQDTRQKIEFFFLLPKHPF